MGRKDKKKFPTVEAILERPWCYYCERDFDDLKILISHQKAKHFKCNRCGRRLNTAGGRLIGEIFIPCTFSNFTTGLAVHMNQVHKEQLTQVDNAMANRQGLEVEIFGMEGVPEDVIEQHRQIVISNYYEKQAEHTQMTGNPPRGSGRSHTPKKPKLEDFEVLRRRLDDWKARKRGITRDGDTPMANAGPYPPPTQPQPSAGSPVYPPSASGAPYGAPPFQAPFGQQPQTGFAAPGQQFPPHNAAPFQPPFPGAPAPFAAGSPPPGPYGLPQRPSGLSGDLAASVDDLISSAALAASSQAAPPPAAEKKAKKDKHDTSKMVYSDNDVSPEEKMAQLSRFSFTRG
jgi:hypothetical protein